MEEQNNRTASEAIMDFMGWYFVENPTEYEKGIRLGLMIAQQIAEEVERQ